MRHPLCITVAIVLLAAALRAQSSTQPQAQSNNGAPLLKARTRLVTVDVVARDKLDRPVTDLDAKDFKVLEDGKLQTVSVFTFQQPTREVTLPSEAAALPPNVYRNTPRFKPNSALNVILLDGLNSTLLEQAYVRDEMIKFLDKLPEGQPVAIYALGNKLRMLQDFTTDLSEIKNIIRMFKGESSHALSNPTGTSEVPMTLQGIAGETVADPRLGGFRTQMEDFAREVPADQMDLRVKQTVTALSSLARMLAGYPGRKNLIWITEAIPVDVFANAGEARINSKADGLPDGMSEARTRRSYIDQLTLIANLFADAQVAVYPIDARGLIADPFFNVANHISGQEALGGLDTKIEGQQAEELFEAHSNMLNIAEKTGGKPFYNRNNIDGALLGDMDDGSTYYTLGYYPDNKNWDGRFRKIQLKVDRPGVTLRYRLGYFAIDRVAYDRSHPQQRDVDFGQALEPHSPLATGLQFELDVFPPTSAGAKTLLLAALDPHKINFETGTDGLHRAEVDCAARVFSPKDIDHPVMTQGTRIKANLKPEVYEKVNRTWLPCELDLDLPPGQYLVRMAVRDNLTGIMGSVNATLTVPENQQPAESKSAQK